MHGMEINGVCQVDILSMRSIFVLQTAHREVLEETGLKIRIEGIINVVSNHLDDLHHTLVIVLIGDVLGGYQNPQDDLTELKWIDE